jgi:hypothetical protein
LPNGKNKLFAPVSLEKTSNLSAWKLACRERSGFFFSLRVCCRAINIARWKGRLCLIAKTNSLHLYPWKKAIYQPGNLPDIVSACAFVAARSILLREKIVFAY